MTAGIILRTVLIGAGAAELLAALLALAGRKMTETLCVLWGVSALLLMAAGTLPCLARWSRGLSVRGLAPVLAAGA